MASFFKKLRKLVKAPVTATRQAIRGNPRQAMRTALSGGGNIKLPGRLGEDPTGFMAGGLKGLVGGGGGATPPPGGPLQPGTELPPPGAGPFGGDVAMQGQGGFQALPEPTVAPTPTAGPAMAPPPGAGAPPSPYGPAMPRPENAPGRIAVRRAANQMMLGGGGRGGMLGG